MEGIGQEFMDIIVQQQTFQQAIQNLRHSGSRRKSVQLDVPESDGSSSQYIDITESIVGKSYNPTLESAMAVPGRQDPRESVARSTDDIGAALGLQDPAGAQDRSVKERIGLLAQKLAGSAGRGLQTSELDMAVLGGAGRAAVRRQRPDDDILSFISGRLRQGASAPQGQAAANGVQGRGAPVRGHLGGLKLLEEGRTPARGGNFADVSRYVDRRVMEMGAQRPAAPQAARPGGTRWDGAPASPSAIPAARQRWDALQQIKQRQDRIGRATLEDIKRQYRARQQHVFQEAGARLQAHLLESTKAAVGRRVGALQERVDRVDGEVVAAQSSMQNALAALAGARRAQDSVGAGLQKLCTMMLDADRGVQQEQRELLTTRGAVDKAIRQQEDTASRLRTLQRYVDQLAENVGMQ